MGSQANRADQTNCSKQNLNAIFPLTRGTWANHVTVGLVLITHSHHSGLLSRRKFSDIGQDRATPLRV
jgi:hypothetical protein